MLKIKCGGKLKKIGIPEKINVKTPRQAIGFLMGVSPEFKKEITTGSYKIISDVGDIDRDSLNIGVKEISIVPVAAGAGLETATIIMIASITLSVATVAFTLMNMPTVSDYDDLEDSDDRSSYIFNGSKNTTAQGSARPILYGKMRVGGKIISAGISNEQLL